MISPAPIILFVYNRPEHTSETLNALSQNKEVKDSVLYIYADGPKDHSTPSELNRINEVRSVIRKVDWVKELHIIERDDNFGLADNIMDGVTTVLDRHGKVIVLEDDIVTSPGFLDYMNKALDIYENQTKVMHISGYMFPIKTDDIASSSFFYNTASCWGWATWAERWQLLIKNPNHIWAELEKKKEFSEFNIGGWANFSKQLRDNIKGIKKTWAVKWYGTIFLNNGYSLHPQYSLVRNIGNDNSGENSKHTDYYNTKLCERLEISKLDCQENIMIRQRMSDFYFHQKPLKHYIMRCLKPILPKGFVGTPFIN